MKYSRESYPNASSKRTCFPTEWCTNVIHPSKRYEVREDVKSIGFWNVPEPRVRTSRSTWSLKSMFKPWGSGTLCSNPGFWNSMFEPWVRELYVRTRGLENSMFEPRVRELLSPPPESSNPGFGNSMFELGVWGLPLPPESSNPGFGNSRFEPGIWGTRCEPRGLELLPPPESSNPGFGSARIVGGKNAVI